MAEVFKGIGKIKYEGRDPITRWLSSIITRMR